MSVSHTPNIRPNITRDVVERLMGKKPEHRFEFIQSEAAGFDDEAIDA
ncbi:hypothetical protein WJS89_00335 [Sphingomicrobium sp. XHP0235]